MDREQSFWIGWKYRRVPAVITSRWGSGVFVVPHPSLLHAAFLHQVFKKIRIKAISCKSALKPNTRILLCYVVLTVGRWRSQRHGRRSLTKIDQLSIIAWPTSNLIQLQYCTLENKGVVTELHPSSARGKSLPPILMMVWDHRWVALIQEWVQSPTWSFPLFYIRVKGNTTICDRNVLLSTPVQEQLHIELNCNYYIISWIFLSGYNWSL